MAGSLIELEALYQRLVAERNALGERYLAGEENLLPQIKALNSRIRTVILEIESLRAVNSSADVVKDDQQALGNFSNTQDPPTGVKVLENGRIQTLPSASNGGSTAGSNALGGTGSAQDSGTNNDLRPLVATQSTAPGSGQGSTGPVREDQYIGTGTGASATSTQTFLRPGGLPGVGAASDDRNGGTGTSRTGGSVDPTVAEINGIDYGSAIVAQANVLDQYASYTYQVSLYLMNEQQYKTMLNTKRKDITGAQLLVQTGGASAGIGRNDYFSLDYYIDNVELRSAIVGKGSGLAHNVSDVKFTVVEPNGITFIKNLDAAVQQFVGGSEQKKKNFTSQLYLMVIRFYGYDQLGNLVRGGVTKPDQTSDPNAFVEKWYPLALSNVKFKVQSKAVEYQIEATAVPYQIAASAKYGTIPYNIELSGQTLKDLLAGPAVYGAGQQAVTAGGNSSASNPWVRSGGAETAGGAAIGNPRLNVGRRAPPVAVNQTDAETNRLLAANAAAAASAPPKANASNTTRKTVRAGLMAALNEYQQDLKNKKIIEVPDRYEVEFALESLASAKITNPGLNIGATSMATPGTAADQKLGSKQSMDPNSRVQGATAGMQIIQFLDNAVRNSSYIKSQQLIVIDEDTGRETTTGVNIQNTSWYKISFEATPIAWDNLRKDYAYNIKYIISPYKISQLNSPYFKPPIYNGSHKQYSYWFTGQNDAVLNYEENLNALYYQILSGTKVTQTSNAIELLKYQYQTRSGQSDQSAQGKVNEPSANAADQLYSPVDLGECNLTIVGDPAWLQQGEAALGVLKGSTVAFQPFLPDGTINFDSQQILFEIGYNLPGDYDLNTGLIQPSYGPLNSVSQQDQILRRQGPTQTNKIYIATEVRSHFSKGKFTQDIKGSLLVYYPDKTAAEQNQRLAVQNAAASAGKVNTPAPRYAEKLRSTVTNPTPSSSLAKGTEALLRPQYNGNLTDNQLLSTPVYQAARRAGKSGPEALAIARAASQNGTNDYRETILPGFRDTSNTQSPYNTRTQQLIVKDK